MADDSEHFQPFANETPLFLTNEKLFSFVDITISPTLPFLKFSYMCGEGVKVKFWGGEREDLMKLAIKKKKKIWSLGRSRKADEDLVGSQVLHFATTISPPPWVLATWVQD